MSSGGEEEAVGGPMSMEGGHNLLEGGVPHHRRSSPLLFTSTGSSSSTSASAPHINNSTSSNSGLQSLHNLRSNSSSSIPSSVSLSSSLASHLGSGGKVKRTRQRVDAGEPRNSYASIANFSSTRSGYQLIRSSGRHSLFGNHHLSPFLNCNNSNSNEGFSSQSSQLFNGNHSPPNFKLLQQLSGEQISPKSLSTGNQSNNDSNNNLGQNSFKSSNNFLDKDSHRNMILLDEAVMLSQMCASAAAGSIPLNGNSTARNPTENRPSDEEIDNSEEVASHLLRDILQTGVGSVRGKQQLEQALAGLTNSKEGLPVEGGRNNNNNTLSQCSDEDEERMNDDEEENEDDDELLKEKEAEEMDELDEDENEEEEDPSTKFDDHEEEEESHESESRRKSTRGRKVILASKQPITEAGQGEKEGNNEPSSNIESTNRRIRTRSQNRDTSATSGRSSSSLVSSGSRDDHSQEPTSPSSDHRTLEQEEEQGRINESNNGGRDSIIEGEEESNGKSIKDNNSVDEQVQDENGSKNLLPLTPEGVSKEAGSPKSTNKLGSRLERLVSNMSHNSTSINGSSGNNNDLVLLSESNDNEKKPPVNGCKKRKLYQPQQSSKLTTEEDDEDDDEEEERSLSDDAESFEGGQVLSDDGEHSARSFGSSSPKRPKEKLKTQEYLDLLKSHVMIQRRRATGQPASGSEDERDGSPISDLARSASLSPPLNFHEIKQQALNKVTAAILNQRCTLNGGNNAEWVSVLKTELVSNVANAIENTFADFTRREPAVVKKSLLQPILGREELIPVVPKERPQQPPKDISLLTQMLESKPSQHHSHHGHHHAHHSHHRPRGATLLGKAPSVRDDRSSKNNLRRPPINGGHPNNVNPFDRDGHPKFPTPFGFPSPMSGFKNPFPFFPHGPNPAAGLPPMPPSLAQHFTSIANALQRQREEALAAAQQSSVANLSRAMEQSREKEARERMTENSHRDQLSPSNRSTNNSSTTPGADTQSEALSLVVSPKRKRSKESSLLNMFGNSTNPSSPPLSLVNNNSSQQRTPSAPPPPPLVPVSLPSSMPTTGIHGSSEGPFGTGPAFPFSPADPPRFGGLFGHRVKSPDEREAEMLGHLRDKTGLAQVMSNAALASLAGHHLKMLAVNQNRIGSPDSVNGFGGRDSMYTKMMTTPGSDNGGDGSEVSLNDSSLYDSGNLSLTREFYYIQMEKYARQAVSEGIASVDDIRVGPESEILRVLNLHYNRNNHIDVPAHFRFVVEQTLKEFFKSVQQGKDSEQSWKKAIYKIIARMDDSVPEYFKSPTFLDQLE